MSEFLERMRESSLARLDEARRQIPSADIQAQRLKRSPRRLPESGFLVFAEIKPSSPLEGRFQGFDPAVLARTYEEAGASAISVLTEPSVFGGSLELLSTISGTIGIPVMRKDFIVDPYQVWEACAAGADGVLVIIRMVDDEVLRAIIEAATTAGMFVMAEVFDRQDAERSQAVAGTGDVLVGVNSRDLATLEVRPGAHQSLVPELPGGVRRIAESGLSDAAQIHGVAALGYDGVLVGSALMRAESPGDLLRSMVSAGVKAK